MTYTATITSKGQVTLPAELRRKLRVKPHDKIRYLEKNGEIHIKKAEDPWEKLKEVQAYAAAHRKKHNIPALSDKELDNAIDQAAQTAATQRYKRSFKR